MRVARFGRRRLAAAVSVLAAGIALTLLPVVAVAVAVPDGAQVTCVLALATIVALVVKAGDRPAAKRPVVEG